MVCVRGPSWSTGRIFVQGSMANHRKTHLRGVAEPGAQFVQLQVWELELAEEAFMQGLGMLPSARQKGS